MQHPARVAKVLAKVLAKPKVLSRPKVLAKLIVKSLPKKRRAKAKIVIKKPRKKIRA